MTHYYTLYYIITSVFFSIFAFFSNSCVLSPTPQPPHFSPTFPILGGSICPLGYYCLGNATPTVCPFNFYCPVGSSALVPGPFPLNPLYNAHFTCTGSVVQWQVPAGVQNVYVKMWGGGGGGSSYDNPVDWAEPGGTGGYTYGTIPASGGNYLYLAVGGGGNGAANMVQSGGWPNGGGNFNTPTMYQTGGMGGGRSQISLFTTAQPANLTTMQRVSNIMMIAGGGGGGAISQYAANNVASIGRSGGGISGNQDPGGHNVAGNQTLVNACAGTNYCGSGLCYMTSPCTGMINGGLLQGANAAYWYIGAGGDGYYGGSSGMYTQNSQIQAGGAGGSGYLNNNVLYGGTVSGIDATPNPSNTATGYQSYPFNSQDAVNNNQYGLGGSFTNLNFQCGSPCSDSNGLIYISYCVTGSYMQNNTCICLDGTYPNGTACTICPANSYCTGNTIFSCPTGTTTW